MTINDLNKIKDRQENNVRPEINLTTQNKQFTYKIDTAADVSIMGKKWLKKLKVNIKELKKPPTVISASGHQLKIKGITELTLQYKNYSIIHSLNY